MEDLSYRYPTAAAAAGTRPTALVGVVASGNLEVLVERVLAPTECQIDIRTPVRGFGSAWAAVTKDFAARRAAGGLKLSVNDGGARPDTVALRLAQAVRAIEGEAP